MNDLRKGLKLPVVALPGVGHMPTAGEDEREAARVFYVAATRGLVLGANAAGNFGSRLGLIESRHTQIDKAQT